MSFPLLEKHISDKVLTISISLDSRGGIVSVVKALSEYYESFNFIASSCSGNILKKLFCFVKCVILLIYHILFKGVKIVHIHSASYLSFYRKSVFIGICNILNVKVVCHIHGGLFDEFYETQNRANILKYILRSVDALIVLSKSWESFFSKIVEKNKITVLNNIIHHSAQKDKLSCNNHILHLLFLGTITETKGIFDLINVLEFHKQELDGKILLHIGGNGDTEKLCKLLDNKKLNSLVKFEGWVDDEKKRTLLLLSDVYILPSYIEGLPISILESMSYGMPIISTKVGGIPEIIQDGVNGFLITPGDKDAILRTITYFIENREAIPIMGQKNEVIVQNYYPEAVIPKLTTIYKKLLEK